MQALLLNTIMNIFMSSKQEILGTGPVSTQAMSDIDPGSVCVCDRDPSQPRRWMNDVSQWTCQRYINFTRMYVQVRMPVSVDLDHYINCN